MQEIHQRGPIACGVAVPDALENYASGIFNETTGDMNIVHDIFIGGWGVENGTKFWTVRKFLGKPLRRTGLLQNCKRKGQYCY